MRILGLPFSSSLEKYLPNQFVESFCSCKLLPNLYIGKNQALPMDGGGLPSSLKVLSVP